MNTDRVPPQNCEAELYVLGAIMLPEDSKQAIPKVTGILEADDFYKSSHQEVFKACLDIYEHEVPVDLGTVVSRLDSWGRLEAAGGVPALDEMIESVPFAGNVEYYAQMVKRESLRRKLIRATSRAYNEAFDPTVELDAVIGDTEKALIDIRAGTLLGNEAEPVRAIMKDAFRYIQEVYETDRTVLGLETGFADLDRVTYGLKSGDYIIVAGRPSLGKSMFCQNLVQNVAIRQEKPCLVFSPEMSKQHLVYRILSAESGIPLSQIMNGSFKEDKWYKLTEGAGKVSNAPIFIDDTPGIPITEIRAKCNQTMARHGLSLVVVDYIQLVTANNKYNDKRHEVDAISLGLRSISRSLNIPVIAVSQLSRKPEDRNDKRPMLSDLRESGGLEQDADMVLLLYRENYYDKQLKDSTTEVIIAKQRNGPTGVVKLMLDADVMKFRNLAKERSYEREPGSDDR